MIHLIGGPPKCGKTTLAKRIARDQGIPWVSTDTLQNVIKPYIPRADFDLKFPATTQRCDSNDEKFSKYSAEEIITAYRTQARTVAEAIDMFIVSEITDGNDFVIEGYHIEPAFAEEMVKKYPEHVTCVFLIKNDARKFVSDVQKSTTPNDWIIARTQADETYERIANMIVSYGRQVEHDALELSFPVINMDEDFLNQIDVAASTLLK